MMKALSIGLGGAVLLALAAGCRPQLAEVELGDAEVQWNSFVSESYPGFRPPRTAAPAIKDKYTSLPGGEAQQPAGAATDPAVSGAEEIVVEETTVGVKPEAAADDPVEVVVDSVVLEPEEGEAPVADPAVKTPAPVKPEAAAAAEPKFTEYVVKPGDTLSGIAKKFYKDGRLFERIYEANKSVIPNPNKLPLGVKIRIPQL